MCKNAIFLCRLSEPKLLRSVTMAKSFNPENVQIHEIKAKKEHHCECGYIVNINFVLCFLYIKDEIKIDSELGFPNFTFYSSAAASVRSFHNENCSKA